jgi:hypothetical protein
MCDDNFEDFDEDYEDEGDDFEGDDDDFGPPSPQFASNHDDCSECMDMKNFIIGIGFWIEMTRGDRKPRT